MAVRRYANIPSALSMVVRFVILSKISWQLADIIVATIVATIAVIIVATVLVDIMVAISVAMIVVSIVATTVASNFAPLVTTVMISVETDAATSWYHESWLRRCCYCSHYFCYY